MDQSMGKRISANRKRLGLTQDQMAERLGVTAQAVSKWENDQSCPDIAMLPKLAELFGISTDELLGLSEKTVHEAVIVEENEPGHENSSFEMQWSSGKKGSLGFAVWVLLSGALLLVSGMLDLRADFWDVVWPSGLLIFGLWGVVSFPGGRFGRISFLRLGCVLTGGYYLLTNMGLVPAALRKEFLLPLFLLLFGMSLLADALRSKEKPGFRFSRNGKKANTKSEFRTEGESFHCSACFQESRREVYLPRLSSGSASVSFGELVVDLTSCQQIADGCVIDLECSFGEIQLLVPRSCRVENDLSTAFGSSQLRGTMSPDADVTVYVRGSVSFGNVEIRQI